MTPLVIIALSAYFKVENKVVGIFNRPAQSLYSSNFINKKEDKGNILNKSYLIKKNKNTKVNLKGFNSNSINFGKQ